jgi:hypothetical protein
MTEPFWASDGLQVAGGLSADKLLLLLIDVMAGRPMVPRRAQGRLSAVLISEAHERGTSHR